MPDTGPTASGLMPSGNIRPVDACGFVTPRDNDSGWFGPNNGGVGITSQGGDSGMQQPGMPIPSFNDR